MSEELNTQKMLVVGIVHDTYSQRYHEFGSAEEKGEEVLLSSMVTVTLIGPGTQKHEAHVMLPKEGLRIGEWVDVPVVSVAQPLLNQLRKIK